MSYQAVFIFVSYLVLGVKLTDRFFKWTGYFMLPKVHSTKSLLHPITHATLSSVPEPFYLTFTLGQTPWAARDSVFCPRIL